MTIQSGGIALLQSLNPFSDLSNSSPPVPGFVSPAADMDPQGLDGQASNFLQYTALAGRAISGYTGLPSEIISLLSNLANLSVAARFARDQFNAFTARAGLLPEPDTQRENTPENAKEKTGKAPRNPRPQPDNPVTTTLRAGQLPNMPLALGALASLSLAGASTASGPDTPVEVADAETLGKVCHTEKYSCSKKYRLIKDIDGSQLTQPIGNKTHPFTGELDGGGHMIRSLSHCLVGELAESGRIDRLGFSGTSIRSNDPAGVAACEMSGNATISNIQVEGADITTNDAPAAIGVGKINGGGTVTNTTAVNCTVKSSGAKSHSGIGAGYQFKGAVINTAALKCHVETAGKYASAGIGAGYSEEGMVTNTIAVNCHVKTLRRRADAGIGVGYLEQGTVTDTTAVNCTVATANDNADAGIGAGTSNNKGTVRHTTAVNCNVTTATGVAYAGIGVGHHEDSDVSDTTAINCRVETSGKHAYAGIGAGGANAGTVTKTTAVNCHIGTKRAGVGILVGLNVNPKNIANTVVVNSTFNSAGKDASVNKNAGDDSVICNVRINGEQQDNDPECRDWLDHKFCAGIDPRLVTQNCQAANYSLTTLNSTNALLTPLITETGARVSSTNMTFSDTGSATITKPQTTVATASDMTFASPGATKFATPSPLAESLSTTVITYITLGVALGTVIFILTGVTGVCVYRYFRQRSSTNADRNREEPIPESPDMPRVERELSTPPRNHHQPQLLSVSQANSRPLPVLPWNHYQPLLVRQGDMRRLSTSPESHYQSLSAIQENMGTGGRSSIATNAEEEPDPKSPDSPVYHVLTEHQYCGHDQPVMMELTDMTKATNSMASAGKEPEPEPQSPDSPVNHVLTGYESDDHDEPVMIEMTDMTTVNNPMASTDQEPEQQRPDSPD